MLIKKYRHALIFSMASIAGLSVAQAQTEVSGARLLDRKNMNIATKPGNDFRDYAGGTWIKNNPVPLKETTWGSFSILRDFNVNAVRTILNEAVADKGAATGSVKKRVADFYRAAMDSITVEKLGFTPIAADYKRAGSIENSQQALDEIIWQRTHGINGALFGFSVGQDRKNPTVNFRQVSQGGITMSDRDYYLKDDARAKKIREAFNTYMVTLFTLAGESDAVAKQKAESIYAIEKRLAKAQMSRVEMRDPYKTYNKFSVADLSKMTPTIDWSSTLTKLKASTGDSILVNSPKFMVVADSVLKNTPVQALQSYLQWNILKNAAPYLSNDFVNANFKYNQASSGQKIPTPRWQRMANLTDGSIGELLGQLYVAKYFKPEAKARMKVMIDNLIKAYEIRIKNLSWMSDVTKQKALEKLSTFNPKIGYPDKWRTYEGVVINDNTLFQNLRSTSEWGYNEMVSQLSKPVDRTRFGMTPPTVNAYYSPVLNEIVFPAGILQFPFFNMSADDAFNYGAIGAVIGHEISHGFDDSGSQYDKDGALRNWWTPDDRTKFNALAKRLEEQYNGYTVLDSVHVNGKLTMGENIGDLGGLNAAYEAFKMTAQGQSNTKIDGFTPDQRFFLAWAQVWRSNQLNDTKAQQVLTDPHSPAEYRTIGPVVNMDAWYKAFNIQPGDKLYKKPEDRIKIW